MVRNYKRKTTDKWSKEDLLEALNCIKTGTKKMQECTDQYHISRATLYRHLQRMMLNASKYQNVFSIRTCGGNSILTKVEEEVLETTVRELMDQGITVSAADIKRICYEYCVTNGIPNLFSESKRMASDDWYYGFLKRRPNLRILLIKGNSRRSKTLSDGQSGGVEPVEEGKGKSQDAPKNLETGEKESDQDACPGGAAPVLKKPLKRLKIEKQKKRRKKAMRPSPTVRRQQQGVRNGKLARGGGSRSNFAKAMSNDEEFVDFEAMEVEEDEDGEGTDEQEGSDDESDEKDLHGEKDYEHEQKPTISGSEDESEPEEQEENLNDNCNTDAIVEKGEGSAEEREKNEADVPVLEESEEDDDQGVCSEEEESECAEEEIEVEEEEQEREGVANEGGIEEVDEESESDFDDDPEGDENESKHGDEFDEDT